MVIRLIGLLGSYRPNFFGWGLGYFGQTTHFSKVASWLSLMRKNLKIYEHRHGMGLSYPYGAIAVGLIGHVYMLPDKQALMRKQYFSS